ncbi:hypothetical protein MPSEU_000341200 [Mayamaea pseudoterrestris]|nr:hypothetical protein MPSEU_000341200 [Mayamaea pseudoterrestris]
MHATPFLQMARGKGKTVAIKLNSTAGTGFFYTTRKNVSKTPEKIVLRKFDPVHPSIPDKIAENVLTHLTCPICLSVPVEPVVLVPCEHLFCHYCIVHCSHRGDNVCKICPTCKSGYSCVQSLKRGSLRHRLWSNVQVTCDNGCKWTGSIDKLSTHLAWCPKGIQQFSIGSDLGFMFAAMAASVALHFMLERK